MRRRHDVKTVRRTNVPSRLAAAALAAATALAPAPAADAAIDDPAQYVNPFVGTKPGGPDFGHGGGAGNTFPGAVAPFGMMQFSPDTATYQHGGYSYDDDRIRGFSLTHLSGAGCGDFGNVPFMPVLGDSPVADHSFSHDDESASPGAYDVTFDNGLRTELAATQRSGVARFTYPRGQQAGLSVDAAKAFNDATGSLEIGRNSISGHSDSGGFCGADNSYRVYFHATFDRDFSARQVDGGRAFVQFDTAESASVVGRIGISFVSADNARANAEAEQSGRGFDEIRDGTRAAWNGLLGRIDVGGGSDEDRRRLYTGLYHSLLHPNVFSDVNGQYAGFDGQVRTAAEGHAQYANYSGWDVYRSQLPLVALIAPDIASDIAQSAVNQSEQGGYFDRWTVANGGTGVMVGDPLPIMVASAHAFGATDFDTTAALREMREGATHDDERPGHDEYDSLGHIPPGVEGATDSVSTTLEYAGADFAISQFAGRLGDTATRDEFLGRAQNFKNLFNPGNRYLQPRNADGSFTSFDPVQTEEYTEGNGAQYTWMVPFNHRGLFDLMGGNAEVVPRLDEFFGELNAGPDAPHAYLGNEPSLNTPWAYAYAGRPDRTQDVVRRALTSLFKSTPDGEVGNDDLGQMSSWSVWASIGMYPQAPGRSELVLASPIFSSVRIDRGNGTAIDITAPEAEPGAPFVRGLAVNGAESSKPWVGEDFVASGGTLDFTLGTEPDPTWGTAPQDAPPSYDES
ncbi:GH92 family glycosyl hydrolase [Saccharopolyspora sp. TS4A08]|uniref:GH92 family glycosyl hydrolase n=1 Tax=Saccharopolyspora ipomoeae TaxID=3042027 RepID=A0ABT6PMJ5_9PSEU|nr:GH92 family glycosyl hydrolase [Saccharopolyspora sp. TS4A08]MDI2029221.1 GH92 family glycosyl hydrolase [Saccharopolyspora sp. TS4A08]